MTASDRPDDEHESGSCEPNEDFNESSDHYEGEEIDLSVLKEGYRPIPGSAYELTKRLDNGRSGFGQVWKAYSERRRRTVVFKFCKEPLDSNKRKSLHNELRLVRELVHPGIVELEEEYLDSPIPFLQYEFIDGADLSRLLRERFGKAGGGQFPLEHAAALILKLVKIIAVCHSYRPPIVHKDLKPQNILVSNYRDLCVFKELGVLPDLRLAELKVIDFGIGAHSRYGSGATTGSQSIGRLFEGAGTDAYASPEQKEGKPAHETDDVFAIGVIWYELLVGVIGKGLPNGVGWVRKLEAFKLRGMTEQQVNLLERCLEPHREDRIQDAVKLLEEIKKAYDNPEEVPSLSDEIAEALARSNGAFLSLDGLTSLSVEVAEALARSNHMFLSLNGLTSLSVEVAEVLAEWNAVLSTLSLNGLTSLSVDVAEALARWNEGALSTLSLNGLTSLSVDVAEALAKWNPGDLPTLSLNGLTSLSVDVAEALAKWNPGDFPTLSLDGLTSLSVNVTEALAKYKGSLLYLGGLTEESVGKIRAYPGVLRSAAKHGGLAMARYLIEAEIDPNESDQRGWTPLLLATKNRHWKIVKLLVGAKADVNVAANEDGNTPLHFAAKAGNAKIVGLLLERGANPEKKNSEGKTPLHCAADSADIDTIRLLLPQT
jgi:serine/threonine protein kinase